MAAPENDLLVGPVVPAAAVTVIAVDFLVEDEAWLEVYKNGSETPLTLGVDYTFTGEGTDTGSITLTVAANGTDSYAIYLAPPAERSSDIQFRGDLRSPVLNLEFDRLVRMVQSLKTSLERTFRFSKNSNIPAALETLTAASRASKYIGFDAEGDLALITGGVSEVPVTAFAATILDDADAATARATLGLGSAVTADYGIIAGGAAAGVTAAKFQYLNGVTSGIQAQINGKQASASALTSLAGLSLVAGDILYATGAAALARRAKGTAGQVLAMNSGATAPEWASGGLQFISSTDASNVASVDFTGWGSLPYDFFVLVLGNVVPATDGAILYLRTTADDATFDSGASDYKWAAHSTFDGGTTSASGSTGEAFVNVSGTVGSAAGEEGVSGTINVLMPHLTQKTHVVFDVAAKNNSGNLKSVRGIGVRESAAAATGVRLLFDTGNIESGTITLYGGRNA